ncbi:MAG: NAD(P)/FAD-dependent oxidoreductase [Chloroflexi bacterium]|nr:NAD(P)/FAD-dependent oxidoreductase [Chloroflexota bacterium]
MAPKTILIVGGGIGGIVAANGLARRLRPEHRIILVDKTARHEFAPSFLWVMVGARRPAQVATDRRRLLHHRVEFVQAEVTQIDTGAQRVRAGERDLPYDYLVLALGAGLAPERVPGLAGAYHTSYTLDGAAHLWDAVQKFPGGRVAVVVAGLPFKCPAAPYETALLLQAALAARKVKAQLDLFTPEPLPMPVAGPTVGGQLRALVEEAGIAYHPLARLVSVDASQRELAFENAPSAPYDLLVAIPPHAGPQVAREAGLANEAGWVPVDGASLKTKQANIFALGDAAVIPLAGRWKPNMPLVLPKAGVFAHAQGEVVAANIATELAGQRPTAAFDGYGYCMVETGHSVAAMGAGNFFATPSPSIKLERPGVRWHWGKVLFERYWLSTGLARQSYRTFIQIGARASGLDIRL